MAECQETRTRQGQRPPRPPPPSQTQLEGLEEVEKVHEESFRLINKGLRYDEEGKSQEAIEMYENGLCKLCQALAVDAEKIVGSEEDKNKVKFLQQKMLKSKLQIEYRLKCLKDKSTKNQISSEPPPATSPVLPSYEEAMSDTVSEDSFVSLGDSIMNDHPSIDSLIPNATEIFAVQDGVQIFFITPEGYVSAPSYPSSLKVLKFVDPSPSEINSNRPPAFLQVDDWYYPLIPGTSPALHATNGAYIFPDITTQQEGAAVGLLLPNTLSLEDRLRFEQTLCALTCLQEQLPSPLISAGEPSAPPADESSRVTPPSAAAASAPPAEDNIHYPQLDIGERPKAKDHISAEISKEEKEEEKEEEEGEKTTGEKIAKGISVAADWISWGVGKGAEKAGVLLHKGSEKVRSKLSPEDSPHSIHPRIQAGARYARRGASGAYKVSSYMVRALGDASMAIAREVTPHISKQGKKLLPKSFTEKKGGKKSTVDEVVEVAGSGIKGFGTVYLSLETAARVLAKSLADETVKTVDYKYGSQAGQFTEDTLHTVGGIAMAAYNVDQMGIKALAKRTAKNAGKEFVKDIVESRKNSVPKPPP